MQFTRFYGRSLGTVRTGIRSSLAYDFYNVDVLGSARAEAYGVNDAGWIVGTYFDGDIPHGFLDTNGVVTTITVPGAIETYASGVNNAGHVVGWSVTASDAPGAPRHMPGFLDIRGNLIPLNVPGMMDTRAYDVNNAGQVVGDTAAPSPDFKPFVFTYGSFSNFDFPNSKECTPYGVNDFGRIVGVYTENQPTSTDSHGFLFDNGVLSNIDVPGALQTFPFGVSNNGQIVGTYIDAATHANGFLNDDGEITTINVPGATSTFVRGINNAGEIVGYYSAAGMTGFQSFLAMPKAVVPSSHISIMAAAGATAAGLLGLALYKHSRPAD